MFSLKIVDTDAFLEMPQSSQLLYYHLSMRADDDGFVSNPKKIMRMVGSQDDDYKILLAKRFVIAFDSGVCVIKHWRIHNYIQADRYQETNYLPEKKSLEIKENGSYTECIQNVSKVDTQVRLGKDRLELGKSKYGEFKNVSLSEDEYQKLIIAITEKNTLILIEELSSYMASKGKKYSNHYATILAWARRKVQDHQQKLETKKRTLV